MVIKLIHIVICDNKENELEKIIKNERTLLLRGNASRKIPHSRIYVNDELYFVNKGEFVSKYHAVVKNAESLSKLTNDDINKIIEQCNDKLNLTDNELKKWKKKCLCIIEFEDFKEIDSLSIPSYTNLNDWLMYNTLEDMK